MTLSAADITNPSRQFYNAANGHIYEWVTIPAITGSQARQGASQHYLGGSQGYLVTITSQQELDFITSHIPNTNGNLYVSGYRVSGTTARWAYQDGPEAGTVFWDNGPVGQFAPWDPIYALNGGPAAPTMNNATALYIYSWFRPYIAASWGTALPTLNQGGNSGYIVEYSSSNSIINVSADSTSLIEGNSNTTPFMFTVTRSNQLSQTTTVNWAVTGLGSNTVSGADFLNGVLPSGTITFAPGDTAKTITIDIAGDVFVEQDESFTITLSNASADASIGTASVIGVIQNDDANLSIAALSANKLEGSSGTTPFTFTVTRSGYIFQTSVVNYSVSGSGATQATSSDFLGNVLPSGTVSFAAGETSKTITLYIATDNTVEASEGFTISLSSASVGTIISTANASGAILNDDASVTIGAVDAIKAEGNSGTTDYIFAVTRSGYLSQVSTVDWTVGGYGPNQANAVDFASLSGSVSFGAGESSKLITVQVKGDNSYEATEGFVVSLENASAGTSITQASALGSIQNDDAYLQIATVNAIRSEGNSTSTAFTFTVSRGGNTAQISTVAWAVTGSGSQAASATDFLNSTLPFGTVTFAAGETIKAVTVNVVGDTAVEVDEAFSVTLSNPSAGSAIQTAVANGIIKNDDTSGTVVGNALTDFLGGNPSASWDYGFGAAGTSFTAYTQFDFNGHQDGAYSFFPVGFSGWSSSGVQTSSNEWNAIVAKNLTGSDFYWNDVQAYIPSNTLFVHPGERADTIIRYDFTNAGAYRIDGRFSILSLNPSGVEAKIFLNGRDISASAFTTGSGVLNGPAATDHSVGGGVTFSWSGIVKESDNLWFAVSPAGWFGNDSVGFSATVTALESTLSIAATAANKAEGNASTTPFTFTVTRTGFLDQTSTVNWVVSGSGTSQASTADFAASVLPSGLVTFAPGEASKTITVQVNGDSTQEANEGFVVTLSNASAGTAIGTSTANGLIQNDDATLNIAATSAAKPEGNTGTTDFTFTVTRAGYLTQATTVDWAVGGSGASPANAGDFLNGVLPSGTVSFTSGQTSQLITVQVAADSTYEAYESFVVLLTSPSAGALINQTTATGVIQNDDAQLSIAGTNAIKSEGNSGLTDLTFTVTRIGNTTQASSANWSVAGFGTNQATASDFANGVLPSGTVNFASGELSKLITVQVTGDSAYEPDETFAVTLSAPSVGTSLGTATATGTIQNDDASLSIAAASAIKAEAHSGLTDYTFTVTRIGNTNQASTANWAVTGSGSAPATANDFENATLPTGTVSFAAGEITKTITVKVASDNLVEQDEGFTVTLSNSSVGTSFATTSANGLILNNDATASIAATSATKFEGHSGTTPFTFTVTRSGYTTPAATIDWAVTGAGIAQATADDFVGKALPTGTVSFGAGETTKTITVNVAGDTAVESNEEFKVTLANPSAGLTIGTASANGTIQNDDAWLSIAATSATLPEGNTGTTTPFTFTVTRSGYLTQATTANWTVAGTGSNAANAADFTGGSLPSGTVSFANGETSKTITVNVNGDTTVELSEQFTVSLSAPSPGAVITTASATGTIQADDVASTGNDQFEGGAGVDTFNGLAGDDVIIGGGGADRLTGGLGADLFKYLQLSDAPYFLLKMERITDFNAAQGDRIDLSAIDANAGTLLNDAFTFLGLADFSPTNATGQLIFDYDDGLNIGALFGSVNADATPELAILLPGVSSLNASSIIL